MASERYIAFMDSIIGLCEKQIQAQDGGVTGAIASTTSKAVVASNKTRYVRRVHSYLTVNQKPSASPSIHPSLAQGVPTRDVPYHTTPLKEQVSTLWPHAIVIPQVHELKDLYSVLKDLYTDLKHLSNSCNDGSVSYVPVIAIHENGLSINEGGSRMHGGTVSNHKVTVAITNAYHLQDDPGTVQTENPDLAANLESKMPRIRRRMLPSYAQRITNIINSTSTEMTSALKEFIKMSLSPQQPLTSLFGHAYLIFMCHAFYRLAEAGFTGPLSANIKFNESTQYTIGFSEGKPYILALGLMRHFIEEPLIPLIDFIRGPEQGVLVNHNATTAPVTPELTSHLVKPELELTYNGTQADKSIQVLSVEEFNKQYWSMFPLSPGMAVEVKESAIDVMQVCEDVVISTHRRQRTRMGPSVQPVAEAGRVTTDHRRQRTRMGLTQTSPHEIILELVKFS